VFWNYFNKKSIRDVRMVGEGLGGGELQTTASLIAFSMQSLVIQRQSDDTAKRSRFEPKYSCGDTGKRSRALPMKFMARSGTDRTADGGTDEVIE
jgi:hypothetical protein